MQRAVGVVDLEALAQRVERIRLAREGVARHQQAVGDAGHARRDRRAADAAQFLVEEADVEAGVVDDDLGAAEVLEQFVGDRREQRLVGEELVGDAVDLERILVVAPLGVDVEMQVAAGEASVDHLDAADLDDAVAGFRTEARWFRCRGRSVAWHGSSGQRAASRRGAPPHHQMRMPAATIGTHSHWPMLMLSASRPRNASGSRKYSAMKRRMP